MSDDPQKWWKRTSVRVGAAALIGGIGIGNAMGGSGQGATDLPSDSSTSPVAVELSPVSESQAVTAPPVPQAAAPGTSAAASEPAPVHSPLVTAAPTVPATSPPSQPDAWRVTSVADGDSFRAVSGATEIEVRMAQVDAPEGTDCFGPESGQWLRGQMLGQEVILEPTSDGPDQDQYGRKVREVWLGATSMNVETVRLGYATHYSSFASEDPDLAARMRSAETEAKADNRGVWSACQTGAAPPPPPPTGTHTGKTDGGWACHDAYRECLPAHLSDLDCDEVGHEVQLTGNDDPWRLDGNNTSREDGVGCVTKDPWSSSASYPYYSMA